jgi:hypothetical protein
MRDMFRHDDAFAVPDPEAKIWRFMDLAKLVSLLSKRALFFSRVDKLDDPFEGSLPRVVVARAEAGFDTLSPEGREIIRNARQHAGYLQSKLWTMINCWCVDEHESAAMWKLHGSKGVAIQSTVQRFSDAIAGSPHDIVVGLVRYLDFETEGWEDDRYISTVFHKRLSFQHEHELRAAICQPMPGDRYSIPDGPGYLCPEGLPGTYVDVDLVRLIQAIHLSPGSTLWFRDVVKTVAGVANLDGTVLQSRLDGDPLW